MRILDREEIDRELRRQDEENGQLAGALLAMDSHPGHQLLRDATLTGMTLRRWTECAAAMTVLWEQFAAHQRILERARQVRDRRGRPTAAELGELTALLIGSVVDLDADRLPIERRGAAVVAETIPLSELVSRMRTSQAAIMDTLTSVDAAWARTVGQLDPLASRLRTTTDLAVSLNASRNRMDKLAEDLTAVRKTALTDPLAADENGEVARVAADLDAVRAELDQLAAVRDTFESRIAALRDRFAELESAQDDTRKTASIVLAKIANPGLLPVDDVLVDLRSRLERLNELRQAGKWQQLGAAIDELENAAFEALTDVRTHKSALTGLVERRAELRGRLAAYQAKARRLGHTEDLDLIALHRRAHDLLFTAPCDLPAATVAVNRYREAVRDRTATPAERPIADERRPR